MKNCDLNFGKVSNKTVKVFQGEKQNKDIEIIGQKGNYTVWTNPEKTELSSLRGKTGNLSQVKGFVSSVLCSKQSTVEKQAPETQAMES